VLLWLHTSLCLEITNFDCQKLKVLLYDRGLQVHRSCSVASISLHILCICVIAFLFFILSCSSLINYMEQSTPSDADSYWDSWQIPSLLCNVKVHYHVYKSLPLVPVLSQMSPVHTFPTFFLMMYFNIILPSMPWASSSCYSLVFPSKI
jgi:hypothetical protein